MKYQFEVYLKSPRGEKGHSIAEIEVIAEDAKEARQKLLDIELFDVEIMMKLGDEE